MYIICSLFNNGKIFSLLENLYSHLNNIIKMILMFERSHLFSLEIDEIDLASWNIHHDYLSVTDHLEMINYMRVLMLEEEVTFSIHMYDTFILARAYYM